MKLKNILLCAMMSVAFGSSAKEGANKFLI